MRMWTRTFTAKAGGRPDEQSGVSTRNVVPFGRFALTLFAAMLLPAGLHGQKNLPPRTIPVEQRIDVSAKDTIIRRYQDSIAVLVQQVGATDNTVGALNRRLEQLFRWRDSVKKSEAAARVGADTAAPESLRIALVSPRIALPDSNVVLFFSRQLLPARGHGGHFVDSVKFDDKKANIISAGPVTVVAQVPRKLREGTPVKVQVFEGATASVPYEGFQAARQQRWSWQSVEAAAAIMLSVLLLGLVAWRNEHRARNANRQLEQQGEELRKQLTYLRYTLQANDSKPTSPFDDVATAEVPVASRGHELSHLSDLPEPPDELVMACATGQCVLYAGGAVALNAGYPTRRELLAETLGTQPPRDAAKWTDVELALNAGRLEQVTDLIVARGGRETLLAEVVELYAEKAHGLPAYAQVLSEIPFASAITANWDNVVERIFASREPKRILPRDAELATQLLKENAFTVTKFWGDVTEPETITVTADECRRALSGSPTFAKYLASIALSKAIFFVGSSLQTIERFFSLINVSEPGSRRHFALVLEATNHERDLTTEVLAAKYGVTVLRAPFTQEGSEVSSFLSTLRRRVKERRVSIGTKVLSPATLSKVRLFNIGPFADLELTLNKSWNVILGNNGVGKSTILRAIALGLCGDDPKVTPAAQRLLSVSSTQRRGSVELTLGEDHYVTEIEEEYGGVRVDSPRLSPLRSGNLIAMGFPPVRGISVRQSRGPAPDGMLQPSVEDILPIAVGDVDWRLDSLRQWVINVDARCTASETVTEEEAASNRKLLKKFFTLLDDLTPGVDVTYRHVDKRTWQVLVETDDGVVPIQQVSQGMASVFGWIGTLLQRLFEMHPSAEHPEKEAAIVLIDEIDAHLHPVWQRALVPIVREHFPNVQVIATTHSPLLVGGMRREEVWIAQRNPQEKRSITLERPPIDFEGMRADEILTSPLFGLVTTRSDNGIAELNEFAVLRHKENARTQEEEMRYSVLNARYGGGIWTGGSDWERQVERAVQKTLTEMSEPDVVLGSLDGSGLSVEQSLEVKRQLAEIFGVNEETS